MATNPEDIQQDDQLDPNAEAVVEDQGNGDDSPYAALAKDMGWMPKDQYQGPAEEWKDAETFIRNGRDIQRADKRRIESMQSQLDTIARTSASVVEQQVKDRVDKLTVEYTKAVEDGDAPAAFKLSREIDSTIASGQPTGAKTPSPEAQAFAERNSGWFNKPGNEYATARAVELCNMLAAQGYTDEATQLRIAEQRLKQELPQLFGQGMNGKPAPGVNAPGSRAAGPSSRQKGFTDLPKAAQDIGIDMEARGVIKPEGKLSARDIYARNYFANQEGKA